MAEKLGELALIEWLDHASLEGSHWQTLQDAATLAPVIVKSVGWVLREDKHTVVLVPHASQEFDLTFGEICLIKRTILKRKKLRG